MRREPLRAGVAIVTLVAGLAGPAANPAQAAPKPDADKLGRQAEILTEQYNGKRVALAIARRAKQSADRRVRRAAAEYEEVRRKAGALAASRYMAPGAESEIALFASDDPQIALDQSATSS